MQNYLFKVKDMYGLYKQIKKINKNYCLFLNAKDGVYEIHDLSNKYCSLCLKISPSELDSRVLEKLIRTSRHNMRKLFLEIENQNRELEQKHSQKLLDNSKDALSEILDYASKINRDVSIDEMQKIIKKTGEA